MSIFIYIINFILAESIKLSEVNRTNLLEKSLKDQYKSPKERSESLKQSKSITAFNELINFIYDFINSIKSTLLYLKTHEKTKRTIELACALSILTSIFYIALISQVYNINHISNQGLNKLLLMLGIGMFIGAIGINLLQNKFKLNDLLTFSFIVLIISFSTAQFVNSYNMAWFWLVPIGIVNTVLNTLIETAIQKTVPNRFRGKIFGFKAFITNLFFIVSLIIIYKITTLKTPPIQLIHGLAYFAGIITLIILFFRRNFLYYVIRLFAKVIMYLFFSLKVKGRHNLKQKGGLVLAGSHTGWLDGFIIGTASRRSLEFMVTYQVFSWPIIRHFARALAFIPVFDGQGKNALKEAIDDLKCGKAICIFPEGKLSEDGNINKFNRGVARLQTKSQVPIIPFAIHGGFEAWSYHHKLPRFHKIIIEFGEPLYFSEEKDEKTIIEELRERVVNLKINLEK